MPRAPLFTRLCLALLFAGVSGGQAAPTPPVENRLSSAVSRTPPPPYADRALPLLTSLESIKSAATTPAEKDDVAQVLVDEAIHLVHPDGRTFRVRQVAYRVLKEAGVKPLGEDLFAYSKDRQAFHLALASVITPEGEEQPVGPEAILVQTPQRQADLAIYDDTVEVRVIYPRVQVGSITRAITITEDTESRVPGAYTATQIWGSGWPTILERFVVELPPDLASKARWSTLGAPVSEPVREKLADGGLRLSWQSDPRPGRRYEVRRAPAHQVGPVLRLSTFAHWDEVASWFDGLLRDRQALPPELETFVDETVRSAPDRETLLRTLHAKVSDEIRYTSLALGEGDYRPQTCMELWSRRHGDCKDKSNLLAALLRRAGIPARLALLNTAHLGLVDRRSPDFRAFNHAIVAIPDEAGAYTFCDPTIASSLPGDLGPGSSDRDVLVIRDARADWTRTPALSAGRLDYAFELNLSATGDLEGWMTLKAAGLYGAWERDRYRQLDSDARRSAVSGLVREFFPGAEVIDAATLPPAASAEPAIVRAYFIVAAASDTSLENFSLTFPKASPLLNDPGASERRDTPYFLSRETLGVSLAVTPPPGFAPAALPSPLGVDMPSGKISGRWEFTSGRVRGELEIDMRDSSVPPAEFPRFCRGMLAANNWLAQSLALSARDAGPVKEAAPVALDLPLMLSGSGQLALLDRKYPADGDRALRRAALERTLDLFRDDAQTVFTTGIYLADLEWRAANHAAALDRLNNLLASYRGRVPAADVAWAEHLRAFVLRELGRAQEAVAVLTRLARDSSLDPWRRSQCALGAVPLLETVNAGQDAIELLALCAPLISNRQDKVLAALARLLLDSKQDARLREVLDTVARSQPSDIASLLTGMTEQSLEWPSVSDESRARWVSIARALAGAPGPELEAALQRAETESRLLALAGRLQSRLRESCSRPPLSLLLAESDAPAAPSSWNAYGKSRQALVDQNDSSGLLRLGLRALLELPPSRQTIDHLWRIASDADWHERRTAPASDFEGLTVLLDLCENVPSSEDTRQEAYFLRGARFSRLGRHDEAKKLFASCLADPGFSSSYRLTAHVRLAEAHENLGELPEAIAAARPLEDHVADSARNTDRVFRSVLLNLHLGRAQDALRLLGVLEQASEDTLRKANCELLLRELLDLRRSGHAEAFWAARDGWWPQWERMAAALNLPPAGAETFAPVIVDLAALRRQLQASAEKKDSAAFWRDFRTLVSAARWAPSIAPQISSVQPMSVALAPGQSPAFVDLVLALLAAPGHPVDIARLRGFHTTATLYDAGRHAEAIAAVAAYRGVHPLDDPQTHAVNRIWALSALASGQQLAEASAALEHDLAHPAEGFPRARTVEMLANLYRARHLADSEAALLERELAHPLVVADEAARRRLAERHERVGGSLRLAAAVRAWLRDHPLPWYDYATPASLEDPRLRDLTSVLQNPERHVAPQEILKLRLLAAQEPEIGLAAQLGALGLALQTLHEASPTHSEALRFAESVLDRTDFDETVRAGFLWHLVGDAYDQRRPEFARWRDHPLASRYNDAQRDFVAGLSRSHAFDPQDPAALETFARSLLAGELGHLEVAQLYEALSRLVQIDEFDRARSLVGALSSCRLAPGYPGSRQSVALSLTRLLRSSERLAPVHRALREKVLSRFPAPPTSPPAAYAELRLPEGALPDLAHDLTREAGLWLLGSRRYDRTGFKFWARYIQASYLPRETRELALELIELALKSAPDDETRAQALASLYYSVDHDEPATLARLRAITEPYDDPVRHPLCARYLRVQRLVIALRLDEPLDFEAALGTLDGPDDGYMRALLALRRHLQRDDLPALKRTLANLPPDLLLSPSLLHLSLPALARAGLVEEQALARETALDEFRHAVTGAWINADRSLIQRALQLAGPLALPQPFPPGWVESVSARCADPITRGHARLTAAWQASDWETAQREARSIIETYPTYYSYHWYAGASLHRLGRTQEARPYLETYVAHSKDELDYPRARALLNSGSN